MSSRLLTVLLFSGVLAAQVPTDSIVALTWFPDVPSSNGANRVKFVDPRGGGTVDAYIPFLVTNPLAGAAVDAANPQRLHVIGFPGAIYQGIDTWDVGPLATPVPAWTTSVGGSRVRVGPNHVYFLTGSAVQRIAKTGGAASAVASVPGAVDIAIVGNLLYVASRNGNPAVPSPVVEIDLLTNVQRTVGTYAYADRIAASPAAPRLALAVNQPGSFEVDEIDVASGALLTNVATQEPVVAVTYSTTGHLIYATSSGSGFDIYSGMAVPPRVFTAPFGRVVDLDYARAVTASVAAFRIVGSFMYPVPWCGIGASVQWGATGIPSLGNSSFALSLANAPANTVAALFLGRSRTFSSVHQTALPIDLTPLGLTNCPLLVDPELPVVLPIDAAGNGSLGLPIPNTAALAGVEFVGQAFVADATFTPFPFAATWGIVMKLNP